MNYGDSHDPRPRNIVEALEMPESEYIEFEPEGLKIVGREVDF